MRILAHVHTFNDEEVIEKSLRAIRGQSHPVDAIVIVDNGSRDATLARQFPADVSIVRHGENLGTSGAVHSGMRAALEGGYDWVWTFDADSAPRPDALAKLFDFYDGLSPEARQRVHRVCSLPVDIRTHEECHGLTITERGFETIEPSGTAPYECVATIWSGSLFRVEAIRRVGLPSVDYVLDWGEYVYGYHAMLKGYRAYVVPTSIVDHNIGEHNIQLSVQRFGPIRFTYAELPPIRYYYVIRNSLFFWLYEYRDRSPRQILRVLPGWRWLPAILVKLLLLGRWSELMVSLRAIRDGLLGRLDRRF